MSTKMVGPNTSKPNKHQVADAIGEIASNENKQSKSYVVDLTVESKNGTTSSSSMENSNSKEKVGQKKQENGKDEKKSNGHKNEKSREQQISRQQKEIELNKIIDVDMEMKIKPGPKSKKDRELKELKDKITFVVSKPVASKTETSVAPSTPTKLTVSENSKTPQKRPQRVAAIAANASISSLAADKDLKGFGDEMESLIYPDSTPMSISISDTSVTTLPDTNVTPSKEPNPIHVIASPLSLKEANEKENDKKESETIKEKKKNEILKGEKEKDLIKKQSANTSLKSSCIPVPITSTPEGKKIPLTRPPSSLRQISGRRSLHPSKDCSFQSQYRESYRKINTELDLTNTSINVTVGSELNANDSVSSFSFWGRGRKRERTPPPTVSSATDILTLDSPKRARIDFSGFFGFVASPVTMLRSRLARTKIENYTNDVDGVENLDEKNSGDANDEKIPDNEKIEDEELEESFFKEDEQTDTSVISEKSLKSSSDVDEDIQESDDNMELIEEEVPKRRCNIM